MKNLAELVSVGFNAFEAFKASTIQAAENLKRIEDVGTIEVGKIVDLILLTGNPLENITNIKGVSRVIGSEITINPQLLRIYSEEK